MDKILGLAISYPDFQLNQIIDPDQVDLNNAQIVDKINKVIEAINTFTQSTTGASNITIVPITEFSSARNVQEALQQIATFVTNNKTLIDQILTVNTTQTQEISALKGRATAVEQKNTEQDGRLTSLESRTSAVESKNTSQDSKLENHETRVKTLETNTYTKSDVDTKLSAHVNTGHDDKYYRKNEVYTKAEISGYLKGGDTSIVYEVYTIVNPLIVGEDGARTFTYRDNQNNIYTGEVLEDSTQVFNLRQGYITPGLNRIEATINDTLTRSVASGGLREITDKKVGLTSPEGAGTEITLKYYQRIDLQGQHQVFIGKEQPPFITNTLWFKTL